MLNIAVLYRFRGPFFGLKWQLSGKVEMVRVNDIRLQNVKGKAKPYQVKQLLQLIETHNLQMEE
jgi:hypothetical protein